MSDARYGVADPIRYPQIISSELEYLTAVYRRAPDGHPFSPMWTVPVEDVHFQLIEGSAIKCLGLLSKEFVDPISALVDATSTRVRARNIRNPVPDARSLPWLENAMSQACDRLRSFPSTFRDTVFQCAQVQRYWLMCEAFLLYEELIHDNSSPSNPLMLPTRHNLMGGLTTSPETVQRLFHAGIPIWFLRPTSSLLPSTRLSPLQEVRPPRNICSEPMDGVESVVYYGLAGTGHIQATCRLVSLYRDVSCTPLLTLEEDDYSPPMSQRQYKKSTTITGSHQPSSAVLSSTMSKQARAFHPCKSHHSSSQRYSSASDSH